MAQHLRIRALACVLAELLLEALQSSFFQLEDLELEAKREDLEEVVGRRGGGSLFSVCSNLKVKFEN